MRLEPADLDPARDPAIDLDAHVNARWREAAVRPADRAVWDSFSILQAHTEQVLAGLAQAAADDPAAGGAARVVGAAWRAGLDHDARERAGLGSLAPRLDAVAALRTPAQVAGFVDAAHAAGEDLLWTPVVAPDPEAPARPLLGLHPARLTLPNRDDLLDPGREGARRRRLARAHLRGLLLRAGLSMGEARAQAAAALDIDVALAVALPSPRERDAAAFHHPLPWAEAERRLAPWRLAPSLAAADVAPPARLSLAVPGFHACAAELLRQRPVAEWRAWLRARLLDLHARYLDAGLRARHHRFHGRVLRGRAAPPPWRQVLEDLDVDLHEALSELYVARAVRPDLRPRMEALFERLRTAFLARIDGAGWLGVDGRRQARAKVAAMRAALVAPRTWPDWADFATEGGYGPLLDEARRHARRRRLRRLAADGDAAWDMPAHRVNARYEPARNRIVIPAALLQPPFVDGDDLCVLYGGIGAVMAHEMTHALDDQGRRFDAEGRLADDAWNAADREAFDERVATLAAAFDGRDPGDGLRLDGALVAGELVADFGGLAIAHDAFRAALRAGGERTGADLAAADRRFFVAWAVLWRQSLSAQERQFRARVDPHPPAALRADAPARALPAFAAAFGCGPRPDDGAGVW